MYSLLVCSAQSGQCYYATMFLAITEKYRCWGFLLLWWNSSTVFLFTSFRLLLWCTYLNLLLLYRLLDHPFQLHHCVDGSCRDYNKKSFWASLPPGRHTNRFTHKGLTICSDACHTAYKLFSLLPSGYRSLCFRNPGLTNIFIYQTVMLNCPSSLPSQDAEMSLCDSGTAISLHLVMA